MHPQPAVLENDRPQTTAQVQGGQDWYEDALPAQDVERGVWAYRAALVFLILYFLRPQDWVPGMAGFNIIRPLMLMWFASLLAEGLNSPLRGFFRTPHDWVMLALYTYVVWNAPSEAGAGSGMFSLVIFYYLTVQSLSSWQKVEGYIRCWTWLLIIIALTGVLQVAGIDITGGAPATAEGRGRLALGTWLCNNPNALGHTVAAGLPLSYMMFFYRGGFFGRTVLFPLAVSLIIACAWHTQSKGSFLIGGLLCVLLFVVGRPKWVQVIVLGIAMSAGVGALSFMPRMEKMGDLRSDEGVVGRLMAWEMARSTMENQSTGAGWKQFEAWITFKEGNSLITEHKATHSSYVQIGAELGKYGMFFWLLPLLISMRSLLAYPGESDEQEKCRRSILLLLTAYMVSGWMINRQYHTEYYLITALAAAYYRNLPRQGDSALADSDSESRVEPESESSVMVQKPSVAGLEWSQAGVAQDPGVWVESVPATTSSGKTRARKKWERPDWLDVVIAYAGVQGVIYVWDWVMVNL